VRVSGLVIDDLAAVIAARDPPQRRTELLAIDQRRKCCEVGIVCNSASAAQNRRYEVCVKIRQARPESAREILRQRVIGMLLVFRGAAYLIHVTNRVPRSPLGRQALHDLMMFLGNVKPVERVEQSKAIALRNQERLPVLP